MWLRWGTAACLIGLAGQGVSAWADGKADVSACVEAVQRHEYDQGIALCSRALETGNLSADGQAIALNDRAAAYHDKGDVKAALNDYAAAVKLNPDFAEAYNNRGNALDDNGDHAGALADFDQAIRLKPDYAEAYANRGDVYGSLGNNTRAIQDYDTALKLDAGYAGAYNGRGAAYQSLGQFAKAVEDYGEAIRLNPKEGTGYSNRGNAYRDMGQFEDAIADYDNALRLNPGDAGVWLSRGLDLFFLNRYEDAAESLKRYTVAEAGDPYGTIFLYLAQRKAHAGDNGQLAQASRHLDLEKWPGPVLRYFQSQIGEDAVEAATNDPDRGKMRGKQCEAAYYLGEAGILAGHTDDARASFQRAISICPRNFLELTGARAALRTM